MKEDRELADWRQEVMSGLSALAEEYQKLRITMEAVQAAMLVRRSLREVEVVSKALRGVPNLGVSDPGKETVKYRIQEQLQGLSAQREALTQVLEGDQARLLGELEELVSWLERASEPYSGDKIAKPGVEG